LGNNVLALTFPAGKLVTDIDSITLVNNTLLNHDIVVPAGERWWLLNAKIVNPDDVVRAVYLRTYLEAARTNRIQELVTGNVTAGTHIMWPNNVAGATQNNNPTLVLLEGGHVLNVYYAAGGASTGGTDGAGVIIQYLKL
jgi:hypothetical protein